MTQKVGHCRWFGVTSALEDCMPRWTRRYIVLLYLCLELGMYRTATISMLSKVAQAGGERPTSEGDDHTSAQVDVASTHKACANTLEMVTNFLGDPDVKTLLRGTLCVLRPLRTEFSENHTRMRSCNGAFDTYMGLSAYGHGRRSLAQVASGWGSGGFVQELGASLPGACPTQRVLREVLADPFNPMLMQEASQANILI